MSSASTVSVVVPCYRQAHFLGTALNSLRSQSYPRLEIIVVNDGSDDNTDEVVRQFGDQLHYIRQANRGLPAARNAGIRAASGRYLHFLDADDRLHPDGIAWLVEAAEDRDDVLCVMGFQTFEEDERLGEGKVVMPPPARDLTSAILQNNLGPPHCFLCARSLLTASGDFDETLRSCEDWDFWLRLVFAGARIIAVRQLGASYRQHPNSMSKNRLRMMRSRLTVYGRIRRRLKTSPELSARLRIELVETLHYLRESIATESLDVAFELRQDGQYLAALCAYLQCIREGKNIGASVFGACKLLPHRLGVIRLPLLG